MTTTPTIAEDRLATLGLHLPEAPTPCGASVPAMQTGNFLVLSGMRATSGHTATVVGLGGKALDVKAGREAADTATRHVRALTTKPFGLLNRVSHVVRLGVSVATSGDVRDQPKVADGIALLTPLVAERITANLVGVEAWTRSIQTWTRSIQAWTRSIQSRRRCAPGYPPLVPRKRGR